MSAIRTCTPEAAPGKEVTRQITDKKGFGDRWLHGVRSVDNWLAEGLPHLKIGKRRVRIVVEEGDRWMRERFGIQRFGPAAKVATNREAKQNRERCA